MNQDLGAGYDPYAPPQSDLQNPPVVEDPGPLRPVPFEDLEAMPGFWKRVGATFSLAFTRPMTFFDQVPVTEGLATPLRFQLLLGLPLILFTLAISLFMAVVTRLGGGSGDAPPTWLFPAISGCYAIIMPVSICLAYFVGGTILHGLLWVWGGLGNGRKLRQSLRATGYVMAFCNLMALVPCLNYLVPLLAPIMLGKGLARIHRTETWRGICAAYTPMVLAILLVAGIFAVIFALKMT